MQYLALYLTEPHYDLGTPDAEIREQENGMFEAEMYNVKTGRRVSFCSDSLDKVIRFAYKYLSVMNTVEMSHD